jgi:hypothetical protein
MIQLGILIASATDRDSARKLGWPRDGMDPAELGLTIKDVLDEKPAAVAGKLRRLGFRLPPGAEAGSLREALMLFLNDQMACRRITKAAKAAACCAQIQGAEKAVKQLKEVIEA